MTAQRSMPWQTTHSMGCRQCCAAFFGSATQDQLQKGIRCSCGPPSCITAALTKCGVCPDCWRWRIWFLTLSHCLLLLLHLHTPSPP